MENTGFRGAHNATNWLIWWLLFPCISHAETYGVINLTSYHININIDADRNEQNLGLGLGFYSGDIWRYGLEAGFYENSFSDTTTYGLGFVNTRIGEIGPVDIRAGVFVGFFGYENLAPKVRAAGIPTIGDHILSGGLTLAAEFDSGWSIRSKIVPSTGKGSAVVTLQIGREF